MQRIDQHLAPAAEPAIAAKYPDDGATGFNVGDVRGAVYAVRRLRQPPGR